MKGRSGIISDAMRARLLKLAPDTFFGGLLCLTRADVVRYEAALKAELQLWPPPFLEPVLHSLVGALQHHKDILDQAPSHSRFVSESLMPLLLELDASDKLPALVFSFERTKVERYAKDLFFGLEEEKQRFMESPEQRQLMKQWEECEAAKKRLASGHLDPELKKVLETAAARFENRDPPMSDLRNR